MLINNKFQVPIVLKKEHKKALLIFISSIAFAHAQFLTIAVPFFLPFFAFILRHFPKYKAVSILGGLIGALILNVGQSLILGLQLSILLGLVKWIRKPSAIPFLVPVSFLLGQGIWQTIYYAGLPPQTVVLAMLTEWLMVVILSILITRVIMLWPVSFRERLTEEQIVFGALFFAIFTAGFDFMQIGAFHVSLFLIHLGICLIAYYDSTSRALLVATVVGLFNAIHQLHFTAMISVTIATAVAVIFMRTLPPFFAAMASIIPSILFFFYDKTLPLDVVYFSSIFIAATVFCFIPKWTRHVAEQEDYYDYEPMPEPKQEPAFIVKDNTDDQVSYVPMKQFRSLLQLAYEMLSKQGPIPSTDTMDSIPSLCKGCIRYTYCYEKEETMIQYTIQQWLRAKRYQQFSERLKLEQVIAKKCIKPQPLLEELHASVLKEQLHVQSFHGKQMLSLQIQDFLRHLEQAVYELEQDASKTSVPLKPDVQKIRFQYEVQVFSKSKNKYHISGDAFRVFPLNERLVCVLLSDGMGHAEAANAVSEKVIYYMQRLLEHDVAPETAMHTIHYLFSMQFGHDTFATLDVSIIDLQEGTYYCWKAGGMGTYIARDGEVFNVNSFSPPIGAISQFYIEMCTQQLKSNDMIWVVSDGLFSVGEAAHLQEQTFKQLAGEIAKKNLSVHSSLYVLMNDYEQLFPLKDDCTVIAIQMKHSNVPWQGVPHETFYQK